MIEDLLRNVVTWATGRPEVRAVALVGSHARGAARPDSDVDLILLAERPEDLTENVEWLNGFGRVRRLAVENWGRVTSLRAWYASGLEVEFALARAEWATAPDVGTRRVVADGLRVLLDRDGVFERLADA